jgi:hypothetical protein
MPLRATTASKRPGEHVITAADPSRRRAPLRLARVSDDLEVG